MLVSTNIDVLVEHLQRQAPQVQFRLHPSGYRFTSPNDDLRPSVTWPAAMVRCESRLSGDLEQALAVRDVERLNEDLGRLIGAYTVIVILRDAVHIWSSLVKESDIFWSASAAGMIISDNIGVIRSLSREFTAEPTLNVQYCTDGVLGEDAFGTETIFSGIHHVPLGTRTSISVDGKVEVQAIPLPEKDNPLDAIAEHLTGLRHSSGPQPILMFSGGLDSSSILYACKEAGMSPVLIHVLNHEDRTATELPTAQRIASGWGFDLQVIEKPPLTSYAPNRARKLDTSIQSPFEVNPIFFFLNEEAHLEDRAANLGISTCVTGFGGDDVFGQNPSTNVTIDAYRRGGVHAALSECLKYSALKGRSFAPDAWAAARKLLGVTPIEDGYRPPDWFASRSAVERRDEHPWSRDHVNTPAKRAHLRGILRAAYSCSNARQSPLLYVAPMVSQAVVGGVFRKDVADLYNRKFDRIILRQSLFQRSGSEIAWRRSKRSSSNFVFEFLTNNRDELHDYIVDGRVAKSMNVDRMGLRNSLEYCCSAGINNDLPLLFSLLRLEIFHRHVASVRPR